MNPFKDIFGRATPSEREVAIVHEAGHALTQWFSPFVEEITFVSVSVRRNSKTCYVRLGRSPNPPVWYWDWACTDLGGLAGEFTAHGTTNAVHSRDDLVRARNTLAELVSQHGLRSCPWNEPAPARKVDIGEMFRLPVETEVRIALNLAYVHAEGLIERYRPLFDDLCRLLREQSHLLPEDLSELLGDRPWTPKPY